LALTEQVLEQRPKLVEDQGSMAVDVSEGMRIRVDPGEARVPVVTKQVRRQLVPAAEVVQNEDHGVDAVLARLGKRAVEVIEPVREVAERDEATGDATCALEGSREQAAPCAHRLEARANGLQPGAHGL